jgi:hypothetical protein
MNGNAFSRLPIGEEEEHEYEKEKQRVPTL